jgi:DNA-binding winged helix-turn-helix (wHTH) protein
VRIRIGTLLFDPLQRQLIDPASGRVAALSPKAAQLLSLLADSSPRPVAHEQLYERIWPDTFVEPGNLHNLVAELRAAAGDPSFLKTIHRFGYALTEEAVVETSTHFSIVVGDDRIELPNGETIIGRDNLAFHDVSRRHARIVVDGGAATIEDLGSKNGTFLGTRRIEHREALRDGDEVTFGRTKALFVVTSSTETTITAAHPLTGNRE